MLPGQAPGQDGRVAHPDLRRAVAETERLITSVPVQIGTPECPLEDSVYWRTHRERFHRTAKLFLHYTARLPVRVLDVGSHYLHFACLLHHLGFETYGCDVPAFADRPGLQDRARSLGFENRRIEPLGQFRELPYATAQFDVVFLLETVEHWNANPSALLKELHRIIAPDGRLVVTTPNFYGYQSLVQRMVRLVTGRGGYLLVQELVRQENLSHHWKEYARGELQELFGAFGFSMQRVASLTGVGDGTPRWVASLCRPWGKFLYAEYRP